MAMLIESPGFDGQRHGMRRLRQGLDPRLILRRAVARDGLLGASLDQVAGVDAADTHPGRVRAGRRVGSELRDGPRAADGGVGAAGGGVAGPVGGDVLARVARLRNGAGAAAATSAVGRSARPGRLTRSTPEPVPAWPWP